MPMDREKVADTLKKKVLGINVGILKVIAAEIVKPAATVMNKVVAPVHFKLLW